METCLIFLLPHSLPVPILPNLGSFVPLKPECTLCQCFNTCVYHNMNIIGCQEAWGLIASFSCTAAQEWEKGGSQARREVQNQVGYRWGAKEEDPKEEHNVVKAWLILPSPLLLQHLLLLFYISYCRCHLVHKQPHSPTGDSQLGQCSKTIEANNHSFRCWSIILISKPVVGLIAYKISI